MPTLDIFNGDAFSVVSLTDAIRDVRPRPSRLGDMGLFETTAVSTLTVAIERIGDILQLVAPSPRGAPGEVRDDPKRSIEDIRIPHFQRDWSVIADEVQNIRAFGSMTEVETVQNLVSGRVAANMADLDVTDEYSRLGAVQGLVAYKGGSTLDLFAKFGVTQSAEIAFNLAAASPGEGALRKACTSVIRSMRAVLGGVPFVEIHALCGDNFFDDLLSHKEVRDTYKNWDQAQILRESYIGKNRASNPIFEFGGIVWENYGAIDTTGDGASIGINTDLVKFFPVGVPGMFRSYLAPGDYVETVNTLGQMTYAKQWPMQNGKGIHGETQRNILHIATRPAALLRGRRGT